LRGVSEATALRALFKCDFSVRAACREFGGDQTLAYGVRQQLKECPSFEVRDKEVSGAELEELVRVFVKRVKYQVCESKERHRGSMKEAKLSGYYDEWLLENDLNWSPDKYCAGSVFTGGTSGGEICNDFQKRRSMELFVVSPTTFLCGVNVLCLLFTKSRKIKVLRNSWVVSGWLHVCAILHVACLHIFSFFYFAKISAIL
jgi:hypothetical protein